MLSSGVKNCRQPAIYIYTQAARSFVRVRFSSQPRFTISSGLSHSRLCRNRLFQERFRFRTASHACPHNTAASVFCYGVSTRRRWRHDARPIRAVVPRKRKLGEAGDTRGFDWNSGRVLCYVGQLDCRVTDEGERKWINFWVAKIRRCCRALRGILKSLSFNLWD